MTTPQDPNQPAQPGQPGASTPGDPSAPGWAQPASTPPWGAPPPAAPAWGAPPPTQPGWGAPQQPAQPGWGAPQQPGQPGWGASPPPQQWGQPGWNAQPAKSNRKGCWIGLIIVLLVVLVGGGGCVYLVATKIGPAISTELSIQSNSGGEIASGNYNWNNGVGVFTFTAANGVTQAEARDLACRVVKPALKGTQFENTHFVIYGSYGDYLADETTPCS
jgi:hypothetical protein